MYPAALSDEETVSVQFPWYFLVAVSLTSLIYNTELLAHITLSLIVIPTHRPVRPGSWYLAVLPSCALEMQRLIYACPFENINKSYLSLKRYENVITARSVQPVVPRLVGPRHNQNLVGVRRIQNEG